MGGDWGGGVPSLSIHVGQGDGRVRGMRRAPAQAGEGGGRVTSLSAHMCTDAATNPQPGSLA